MSAQSSGARTIIFIDGDWLRGAMRVADLQVDFRVLLRGLRRQFGELAVVRFFASYDPHDLRTAVLVAQLTELGYETFIATTRTIAGRRTSDIDVLLASAAAVAIPQHDLLVVVTGDGDLAPLLEQSRKHGCATMLITLPLVASSRLREVAGQTLNIEDLLGGGPVEHPPISLIEIGDTPTDLLVKKGAYFGTYLVIRRLFQRAQRELTIIDPYVDDQVLIMLANTAAGVVVRLFTKNIHGGDFHVMLAKLRKEGRSVNVYRTNDIHDRFLRIDDEWWHSGHSFKDLGNAVSRLSQVTTKSEDLIALEKELLSNSKPL